MRPTWKKTGETHILKSLWQRSHQTCWHPHGNRLRDRDGEVTRTISPAARWVVETWLGWGRLGERGATSVCTPDPRDGLSPSRAWLTLLYLWLL